LAGKTFRFIFGLVLAFVIWLIIFLYNYNKPHADVQSSKPVYNLSAEELIGEYQKNEQATTEKYAEKIITIVGKVSQISTSDGKSVITINSENLDSSIICNMQAKESMKVLQLKSEQVVKIKGICSGYLLDVMMLKCILVE